jgi:hypothetical protein
MNRQVVLRVLRPLAGDRAQVAVQLRQHLGQMRGVHSVRTALHRTGQGFASSRSSITLECWAILRDSFLRRAFPKVGQSLHSLLNGSTREDDAVVRLK